MNPQQEYSTRNVQRRPNKVFQVLLRAYDPVPMKKPEIDTESMDGPIIVAITEAMRFNLSEFMYKISPQGGIQAWWKLLVKLVFVIAPTLVIVSLLLSLIASVMGQFVIITYLIQLAMNNLMYFTIYAIITICLLALLFSIILPLFIKALRKFFTSGQR
jgi:hypothetical protein